MPRNGSGIYSYPLGTEGHPNTTIESEAYNSYILDIQTDLNTPRPIIAGGTAATTAAQAINNLGGELAGQVVLDYAAQVWQSGSFYSGTGANAPPVTAHRFIGFVSFQSNPPSSDNIVLEAFDLDSTPPGQRFVRIKKDGVWDATWTNVTQAFADLFVNVTGDTMTGQLNLQQSLVPTEADTQLVLRQGPTTPEEDQWCDISAKVDDKLRWSIWPGDGSPEIGGNKGSNFAIARWNDAGALIERALVISRETGNVTLRSLTITPGNFLTVGSATFQAQASVTSKGLFSAASGADVLVPNFSVNGVPPEGANLLGGPAPAVVGQPSDAAMTFHIPGLFIAYFGLKPDGNLYLGGGTHGAGVAHQVWTKRDFGYNPVNKAGDTMSGPLTLSSTLDVTGVAAFHSAVNIDGTATINALNVSGTANVSGVLSAGTVSTPTITPVSGGNLDILGSGGSLRWRFFPGGGLQQFASAGTCLHLATPPVATHGINSRGNSDSAAVLGYSYTETYYGMVGQFQAAVPAHYSFFGNVGAFLSGGVWATSDKRLKSVTKNVDGAQALTAVRALPVKEYQPIAGARGIFTGREDGGEPLYGWLAQDVEPILPIAVRDIALPADDLVTRAALKRIKLPDKDSPEAKALAEGTVTIKAINDRYMLTTLWAAVQEISTRLTALEGGK